MEHGTTVDEARDCTSIACSRGQNRYHGHHGITIVKSAKDSEEVKE